MRWRGLCKLLTTASSVNHQIYTPGFRFFNRDHLASNLLSMANRKRLPTGGPLPPRKSTRIATKATPTLGGDDSPGPSKTATPRPDGDDSSGPKTATGSGGDESSGPSKTATTGPGGDNSSSQKDSSQGKSLSSPEMVQEVAKMVENEDHAELMILELMRKYSFDLSLLQKLLRRKSNQPQVV